jgi:transcriptional regulator with XRE-family HTH domain
VISDKTNLQKEREALINRQEYAALVAESALRPAEIARRLPCSRASVSKILSGKQTPTAATLQSLRRLVSDIKSERRETFATQRRQGTEVMKYPNDDSGGSSLHENHLGKTMQKLEQISHAAPADFKTLESIITSYHKNIQKKKK